MKKIFLTGSTGLLGRKFLNEINKKEYEIILGKRSLDESNAEFKQTYFNLEDDESELNLKNIDIVVHLASDTLNLSSESDIKGIEKILKSFNLYRVKHLVFISIVGVDKIPLKYFKTKHKIEELIQNNCKSYSILRSTQFFEFFEKEVQKQLRKKIAIVPNIKYQPIETDIVAKKLVEICERKSTNSIMEIGGSNVLHFCNAIRTYRKWNNNKSLIIRIPNFVFGKFGNALTTKHKILNSMNWVEYLKLKEKTEQNRVGNDEPI